MLKLSLDKDYKAAIYLRLSKEDSDFSISGEKLESDSISNQRHIVRIKVENVAFFAPQSARKHRGISFLMIVPKCA